MNHKPFYIILAVLLTLLLSAGGTSAQDRGPEGEAQPQGAVSIAATVNSRISYQGVLKENGNPVTGSRDMTFRFYADDVCATQVGSDIVKNGVPVTDGLFSVGLDVTHDDFNGQGLWLQAEVGGDAIGCREIMPVPYALSLRPGADIIGGQAGSSILTVQNSSSANDSRAIRGYVSATTGFTAGVNGRTDSSSTGAKGVWGYAAGGGQTYGVHGESNSTSGRGVFGRANASSGTNFGVYGESKSTSGRGVYGIANATTGTTYGVHGETDSTSGRGVYGEATSHNGTTYGVYGLSEADEGRAVYGWASSQSGENYGVYGRSDSPAGYGVYGWTIMPTGLTYGVYGQSDSTSGLGVYGYASATSGYTYGVYGRTDSPDGVGVYGVASGTGGTNYAVYGLASSPSNYAGYFYGNVNVTGSLNKGGGSFKIDHPLDPENQYLYHSFVESPDMMNVYNGNAVLDENGQAWVELPDYFEALNHDFRYQLTCIGGFAPVYVAHEILDNRFQIAGGEPGLRVSWQVTGIRQDPWANANRIPVEEEKPADEQGYYLHPEVYGQPESRGIEWLHGFRGRQ